MKLLIRIFISLFFLTSTVNAAEFGLAFEWGDIPKCNTGNAKKVTFNPHNQKRNQIFLINFLRINKKSSLQIYSSDIKKGQ